MNQQLSHRFRDHGLRLLALASLLSMVSLATAQPPGGPSGGGFRGGGEGFRGGGGGEGFRGGPPGMMGGPPGMMGGGDRGSRGGPPGMMGGPPGMMGGGDRGSRGGPPGMMGGGDRGSRGGPPGMSGGGFDPSQMLGRLDANSNGRLDPEEMQGPARFFLDRIARDDSEIAKAMSSGKPIPLSRITEAINKLRGSSSNSNSNPGPGGSNNSQPAEPEPLVPTFGVKVEIQSIPGFGPEGADAGVAVKIEERDRKEAKERIERYDRNKDGILDEKEVGEGRWSDNPWTFDRNRDKKLTESELAVRYAKRRQTEETQRMASDSGRSNNDQRRGDDRDRRDGREQDEEPANPWSNQASYRFAPQYGKGSSIQGLPEWFSSGDQNGDGQIMMNEFASSWDEGVITEFGRFDKNSDGTITALEALAAVKQGILRGAVSSGGAASSSGMPSGTTSASSASAAPIDRSDVPPDADEKWVKFVASRIAKSDKDKNGRLTIDEWSPSDGDFTSIDTNADGSITLGEYYNFRKNKK